MRVLKIILLFILIAGNIVLLANWNSIFNPKDSVVSSNRELTLKDSLTIFWDLKRDCDQCRADILEFVRKRNISGCRSHSGWEKYLSSNERAQVESLLCLDKYDSEAQRRIQEYLSGKQFYSWKEVKDANDQVALILKQNEKDREIGRSEMLNLVRKICWYDNTKKISEGFDYFTDHSGWKFLSFKEQSAVKAIYRVSNGKIKLSKDIRTNLRDREIRSWEDVIDIHEEIEKAEEAAREKVKAAEADREKEYKAKEKAKAQAVADAKAQAEKAKAEILELVKKKLLNECRSHPGWEKYLTQEEKFAIECILNFSQYKGAYKKRVNEYVKELKISTWKDITNARQEIIKLKNGNKL